MLTRKLYVRPNTRTSLYLGICGEERHRSFQSPYPATHQQTQNSRKSQQRATNASSSNDLGRSNAGPKKEKKSPSPLSFSGGRLRRIRVSLEPVRTELTRCKPPAFRAG